jgi:hypothetical protein
MCMKMQMMWIKTQMLYVLLRALLLDVGCLDEKLWLS